MHPSFVFLGVVDKCIVRLSSRRNVYKPGRMLGDAVVHQTHSRLHSDNLQNIQLPQLLNFSTFSLIENVDP